VLIVATPSLTDAYTAPPAARAQYAERLGTRADALAEADPLLAPARLAEELQAVSPPEGDPQLTPDRLLRLAVATSQQAVWRDDPLAWLVLGSWLDVCPEKSDLQIP
jgi:hypothetical protein